MSSKPDYTAVSINRDLNLKLYSTEPGKGGGVEVKLNRASAQFLADALFQYAGSIGKKGSWRDDEQQRKMFFAEIVSDTPRRR